MRDHSTGPDRVKTVSSTAGRGVPRCGAICGSGTLLGADERAERGGGHDLTGEVLELDEDLVLAALRRLDGRHTALAEDRAARLLDVVDGHAGHDEARVVGERIGEREVARELG